MTMQTDVPPVKVPSYAPQYVATLNNTNGGMFLVLAEVNGRTVSSTRIDPYAFGEAEEGEWEPFLDDQFGSILADLVNTRRDWLWPSCGISEYLHGSGPWVKRATLSGSWEPGRTHYAFLSWIPGWTVSTMFWTAFFHSANHRKTLADSLKHIMQLDLAALEAEAAFALLSGMRFPSYPRMGQTPQES